MAIAPRDSQEPSDIYIGTTRNDFDNRDDGENAKKKLTRNDFDNNSDGDDIKKQTLNIIKHH